MKKILHLSLILIVFFGDKICNAQNQKKIDSLKNVLASATDDTTRINELMYIAHEFIYLKPDSAIELITEALRLSEKVILSTRTGTDLWVLGQKDVGNSYHQVGLSYFNKSNYSLSLQFYDKALDAWELLEKNAPENQQSTIKTKKSRTLANIGLIYEVQGDYPKALDYDFKALKMAEEIGDKSGIAKKLDKIGIVYYDRGDYPKALDYLFKELKMEEELGDKQMQASTLGNIGAVYLNQGDLYRQRGDTAQANSDNSQSLNYSFKALKMNEEIGDKQLQANTLGNIGQVYTEQAYAAKSSDNYRRSDSLFIKALDYDFKSLKMHEEIGNKVGISAALNSIALVYTSTKKYTEAEKYLLKALAISDSIGALRTKMQCEIALSELYTEMGEAKKALEHYKKAMVAKDTLFNEDKAKEITRKEMNYDFEKKEAATKAEQDKKDALAGAEIKRQALIKDSILAGIGIAGIFVFILVRSFNRRRKTSFEKQVSEVEMKALRAQMNPHFIFNSLRSINEYVQSHKTTLASEYLIKFSKLMRAILENSRQKEIVLSKEIEVLELYMQLESQRMEHPFTYSIEIDPEIDPTNTLIPPMLLQPIVENSIWHGLAPMEKSGKIIIRIKKLNETIQCEVEDDGVGREVQSPLNKESKAESYGLKITAERLAIIEQIKKIKTHLTFRDLNGGDHFTGLNVTFALPLEEAV